MLIGIGELMWTKNGMKDTIKIEDAIKEYRRLYPNGDPTIIFDFTATICMLSKNGAELPCGGRQGECKRNAENILKSLTDLGIQIVFYLDGPMKKIKFPTWLNRSTANYNKFKKWIFSNLNQGLFTTKRMGHLIKSYRGNYLRVAKQFGEIQISFENECDLDIAAYATRIKAMAVVANDSDFLVMPGNWPIWLHSTLNMDKLTVSIWKKEKFRQYLGLHEWQMSIFATLCGNDFVERQYVEHISEGRQSEQRCKFLCELIRNEFRERDQNVNETIKKLTNIIRKVGDPLSEENAQKLIKTSLDFYNNTTQPSASISPEWLALHVHQTASQIVYMIFKRELQFIVGHNIDLSYGNNQIRQFWELVVPLIRRQIGIVMAHHGDKSIEYDFCFKRSDRETYQTFKFTGDYPKFEIPEISQILSKDSPLSIDRKLKMLLWIVKPRYGSLEVNSVQPLLENNSIFLVPVIALFYLVEEDHFTEEEADIILLTISRAWKIQPEAAESVRAPRKVSERGFWISHTYTSIIMHFEECLTVCGLHDFIPFAYFDGFIFHDLYSSFLSKSAEYKMKMLESVNGYRFYAHTLPHTRTEK